jgi:prepilin-type processing-associated H-X9-DG protein
VPDDQSNEQTPDEEAEAVPADVAAVALAEAGLDDPSAQPVLKADKNGMYPHSRVGGNPAAPLAVGGFSSRHVGGVNFALGDGSVRYIMDDVSAGLMGRLANRADGKMISAKEW